MPPASMQPARLGGPLQPDRTPGGSVTDADAESEPPRRRKARRKREHHGGGWKLAYADFVTALMAFFMALWIVSVDPGALRVANQYFGLRAGEQGPAGVEEVVPQVVEVPPGLMQEGWATEATSPEQVASALHQAVDLAVALRPELAGQISIERNPDWIRVELMENAVGETFFRTGSSVLRSPTRMLLTLLAIQLQGAPYPIVLEGHTDARPYTGQLYTNWDLSFDRANAARRILERAGLPPSRVLGVRGYADRRLKYPDAPTDPRNRRISLLVPIGGAAP